jgi:hypothetical protein
MVDHSGRAAMYMACLGRFDAGMVGSTHAQRRPSLFCLSVCVEALRRADSTPPRARSPTTCQNARPEYEHYFL